MAGLALGEATALAADEFETFLGVEAAVEGAAVPELFTSANIFESAGIGETVAGSSVYAQSFEAFNVGRNFAIEGAGGSGFGAVNEGFIVERSNIGGLQSAMNMPLSTQAEIAEAGAAAERAEAGLAPRLPEDVQGLGSVPPRPGVAPPSAPPMFGAGAEGFGAGAEGGFTGEGINTAAQEAASLNMYVASQMGEGAFEGIGNRLYYAAAPLRGVLRAGAAGARAIYNTAKTAYNIAKWMAANPIKSTLILAGAGGAVSWTVQKGLNLLTGRGGGTGTTIKGDQIDVEKGGTVVQGDQNIDNSTHNTYNITFGDDLDPTNPETLRQIQHVANNLPSGGREALEQALAQRTGESVQLVQMSINEQQRQLNADLAKQGREPVSYNDALVSFHSGLAFTDAYANAANEARSSETQLVSNQPDVQQVVDTQPPGPAEGSIEWWMQGMALRTQNQHFDLGDYNLGYKTSSYSSSHYDPVSDNMVDYMEGDPSAIDPDTGEVLVDGDGRNYYIAPYYRRFMGGSNDRYNPDNTRRDGGYGHRHWYSRREIATLLADGPEGIPLYEMQNVEVGPWESWGNLNTGERISNVFDRTVGAIVPTFGYHGLQATHYYDDRMRQYDTVHARSWGALTRLDNEDAWLAGLQARVNYTLRFHGGDEKATAAAWDDPKGFLQQYIMTDRENWAKMERMQYDARIRVRNQQNQDRELDQMYGQTNLDPRAAERLRRRLEDTYGLSTAGQSDIGLRFDYYRDALNDRYREEYRRYKQEGFESGRYTNAERNRMMWEFANDPNNAAFMQEVGVILRYDESADSDPTSRAEIEHLIEGDLSGNLMVGPPKVLDVATNTWYDNSHVYNPRGLAALGTDPRGYVDMQHAGYVAQAQRTNRGATAEHDIAVPHSTLPAPPRFDNPLSQEKGLWFYMVKGQSLLFDPSKVLEGRYGDVQTVKSYMDLAGYPEGYYDVAFPPGGKPADPKKHHETNNPALKELAKNAGVAHVKGPATTPDVALVKGPATLPDDPTEPFFDLVGRPVRDETQSLPHNTGGYEGTGEMNRVAYAQVMRMLQSGEIH